MTKIESQEAVLVVPRSKIMAVAPKVFNREVGPVRAAVVANYQFMGRDLAEEDETYKQVIPYVIIRHENQYLLMRRTKKQTESRLHNLYSLGIGGHINDADLPGANGDLLTAGMRRELIEEIRLESEEACALVGVINDDSTPVARVHLGFVYELTTSSPQFTIMEADKYTAEWKSRGELAQYYPQMETWAQIVHDALIVGGKI
jgi:predicted NUDIX family phosphoesterase